MTESRPAWAIGELLGQPSVYSKISSKKKGITEGGQIGRETERGKKGRREGWRKGGRGRGKEGKGDKEDRKEGGREREEEGEGEDEDEERLEGERKERKQSKTIRWMSIMDIAYSPHLLNQEHFKRGTKNSEIPMIKLGWKQIFHV